MTIRIYNVRLGLATNSSSSHSFIILPKDIGASDNDVRDGEFGWQFFTVASRESKKLYLWIALRDALTSMNVPANIQQIILRGFIGDIPDGVAWDEGYIDHQSSIAFPCAYNSTYPDMDFVSDFMAWLLREDVAILGGNDNTEESHPLLEKDVKVADYPFIETSMDDVVARKEGTTWTIFRRDTGAKVRLSFQDEPIIPTRSLTPELVDIKITDYCPYDCPFCYQGSTKSGVHAKSSDLSSLFWRLGRMKVFEVAIGGGEPTLHPDFINILSSARKQGIMPNFTTKNLAWLRDPVLAYRIMEQAGAFAYSANDHVEVKKLATALEYLDIDSRRANIHLVMGTVNRYTFRYVLEACWDASLRLTLLGYKTSGRGSEFKPQDYSWWLDELMMFNKEHRIALSIDTALALEYETQIKAAGVPDWMYHTQEGKFSCYIDMVSQRIAPSSYADESTFVPLDIQRIEEIFQRF